MEEYHDSDVELEVVRQGTIVGKDKVIRLQETPVAVVVVVVVAVVVVVVLAVVVVVVVAVVVVVVVAVVVVVVIEDGNRKKTLETKARI